MLRKKLKGDWITVNTAQQIVRIKIKDVINSDVPHVLLFRFDSWIGDFRTGFRLFGRVNRRTGHIYFNVPFGNGYAEYSGRLNQKVTKMKFIQSFITTNFCEATGNIDSASSLPIAACVFPEAIQTEFTTGELVRDRE